MTIERAILAGGCFWCIEYALEMTDGVQSATAGYIGGTTESPSYEQVKTGKTGHYEAIEVIYNTNMISFDELLNVFWMNIDPLDFDGQFIDRGTQYRTAIFYLNDTQKVIAEASKAKVEALLGEDVATQILPESQFYIAEENHQDFHKKDPARFEQEKIDSDRPAKLNKMWAGLMESL